MTLCKDRFHSNIFCAIRQLVQHLKLGGMQQNRHSVSQPKHLKVLDKITSILIVTALKDPANIVTPPAVTPKCGGTMTKRKPSIVVKAQKSKKSKKAPQEN